MCLFEQCLRQNLNSLTHIYGYIMNSCPMDKSEIKMTSTLKILLFIPLLHLLLVPVSGSGAMNKLFYVDGYSGKVTLGKNKTHLKLSLFRIRICFSSASQIQIRLAKNQSKSWKIHTKIQLKSQEYRTFSKLHFCLTFIISL